MRALVARAQQLLPCVLAIAVLASCSSSERETSVASEGPKIEASVDPEIGALRLEVTEARSVPNADETGLALLVFEHQISITNDSGSAVFLSDTSIGEVFGSRNEIVVASGQCGPGSGSVNQLLSAACTAMGLPQVEIVTGGTHRIDVQMFRSTVDDVELPDGSYEVPFGLLYSSSDLGCCLTRYDEGVITQSATLRYLISN